MNDNLSVKVKGQGLYDITGHITSIIDAYYLEASSTIVHDSQDGLCTIFIQHTSASLLIQENYDPSAKHDLERWLNRLVPENDPLYTHTTEGPDDMPAHIKAALTASSLSIPIINGSLALGTWQGIFLWEHRHHAGNRKLLLHW